MAVQDHPSGARPRVLIADDHTVVRRVLRTAVERYCGYEVLEADNGLTAVDLAGRVHPDLILMDVDMPGINGVEATRRIVHADMGSKVIGLSIHSATGKGQAMLDAGAVAYLPKGGDLKNTCRVVKEIVEHSEPGG